MHCMYSSMVKGTSQAEAMSNSDKIKHVALAIVELHEFEGSRQLVSQSVGQSVSQSVENFIKHFFLKIL